MNRKTPTLLTMLVLVSTIGLVFAASDDSSAEENAVTCTVTGYVGAVGDSGMIPHQAAVTIYSADGAKSWSDSTDPSTGKFEIQTALTPGDITNELLFKCESMEEGYAVFGMPAWMSANGDNYYADLGKATVSGIECVLSPSIEYCVVMSKSQMDITIIVSGSDDVLRFAEVTLLQDGDKKYAGRSNEDGNCIISDVVVGTYDVKISCHGYMPYENTVTVSKNTYQFTAEMNEKNVETYYGLTAYHILVIVGVSIGLVLVVVSYVLYARSWKNVDSDDLQS